MTHILISLLAAILVGASGSWLMVGQLVSAVFGAFIGIVLYALLLLGEYDKQTERT